jgi:uncharacterized protein
MATFRILSIDGGGIKGILPAAFLAATEEAFGSPLAEHFDLIAGTSTGGIIALALGLGVPASSILDFYKANASQIFPTSKRWPRFVRSLFRSKYDPAPLREALEGVFGSQRLGDAKVRLLIPAISASTGDVHLYKTPHDEKLCTDFKEAAVDVAMATAAAPTFFPVHRTKRGMELMDGGLWANNPLMVAVVEAMTLLGQRADDIRALTVGCTATPMGLGGSLSKGGRAQWALPAIDWLMHGQSLTAVNQARLLIGKENVLRIQHMVPPGRFALDGAAAAMQLEGPGRELARVHFGEVRKQFLAEPKQPYVPHYGSAV